MKVTLGLILYHSADLVSYFILFFDQNRGKRTLNESENTVHEGMGFLLR